MEWSVNHEMSSTPRHVAAASDVDSAITRPVCQHNATEGEGEGEAPLLLSSFPCATERLDRGSIGLLDSANLVSSRNREAVCV